jgi:hypothetical protein
VCAKVAQLGRCCLTETATLQAPPHQQQARGIGCMMFATHPEQVRFTARAGGHHLAIGQHYGGLQYTVSHCAQHACGMAKATA